MINFILLARKYYKQYYSGFNLGLGCIPGDVTAGFDKLECGFLYKTERYCGEDRWEWFWTEL